MRRISTRTIPLQSQNPKRTKLTKGRILEVSDDEAIREIVGAICEIRGFDVFQARCGDEALNLYRKFRPFALVLSDLYWNDGSRIEPPINKSETIRHGIQLALAIRKLAPKQKIVIHTAALQIQEQMPPELTDIRFLQKPFSRTELESLL